MSTATSTETLTTADRVAQLAAVDRATRTERLDRVMAEWLGLARCLAHDEPTDPASVAEIMAAAEELFPQGDRWAILRGHAEAIKELAQITATEEQAAAAAEPARQAEAKLVAMWKTEEKRRAAFERECEPHREIIRQHETLSGNMIPRSRRRDELLRSLLAPYQTEELERLRLDAIRLADNLRACREHTEEHTFGSTATQLRVAREDLARMEREIAAGDNHRTHPHTVESTRGLVRQLAAELEMWQRREAETIAAAELNKSQSAALLAGLVE